MARSTPSRRSKNLFGFGKRKPARKKKVAAKRRGLFGFLTEQKVTYRRDVAAERKEREQDRKASLAMLKRAAADRARSDRERKREADRRDAAELRQLQIAEKKRKAERKASDDADRKIEREMRDKGYRNPGCAKIRKTNVSDRAKRYRANQRGCKPGGVQKCKLCPSKSDLMVDHIDGNESNGRKSNLRWLCRSCNTLLGAEMARAGQGRRTVQYNPAGAQTLGEYMQAVLMHSRGAHDEGGAIIHATPKWKRQEYASKIWDARSQRSAANPSIRRTKKAGKKTAIDSAMETMSERYGYPESKQLRKVAQRIQRDNPNQASPEYRLGYNLGQVDRNTAALRKTPGELHATFTSLFGTIPSADWQSFEQAYKAGYGGHGETRGDAGRRGQTRGNPEPAGDDSEEYRQAKKIAELFHGRPVKEEIEIREEIRSHDWYAELGPLVELRVKGFRGYPFRTAKFKFGRKGDEQVLMLTSPDGRQFYCRGGDQEINLEILGMEKGTEWYRHFMTLGEVTYFSYLDGKKFHGFKMTEYTHKVGSALDSSGTRHIQKTNAKPVMIYDTLSGKISFSGGQGKVETDMLVDGMSPGIVN